MPWRVQCNGADIRYLRVLEANNAHEEPRALLAYMPWHVPTKQPLRHTLRYQPMKMVCTLLAFYGVSPVCIKPRSYALLHILHHLFIFHLHRVKPAAGASI